MSWYFQDCIANAHDWTMNFSPASDLICLFVTGNLGNPGNSLKWWGDQDCTGKRSELDQFWWKLGNRQDFGDCWQILSLQTLEVKKSLSIVWKEASVWLAECDIIFLTMLANQRKCFKSQFLLGSSFLLVQNLMWNTQINCWKAPIRIIPQID